MLKAFDTIVACSTPPGRGAISVVRIEGKDSIKISEKILGISLKNNIQIVNFPLDIDLFEKCVLTIFKAPKSYTGDNIVEIAAHGNPLLIEKIINMYLSFGARLAKPGEFTEKAFLNGKMSIDQSESVINVINANSDMALKAAHNSLKGGLKEKIIEVQDKLRATRVLVETLIDFSDEDINIYLKDVESNLKDFRDFCKNFKEFMVNSYAISNDVNVAIIGPPNAGKSTLINAIVGKKVSIVSEIRGTTRDIISSSCLLEGIRFNFKDTAGLRNTTQKIEREGVKLSKKAIREADFVIFLAENEKDFKEFPYKNKKNVLFVINKIDKNNFIHSDKAIGVSAKTRKNLSQLKLALVDEYLNSHNEELLAVNTRHLNTVKKAYNIIRSIKPELLLTNIELVAEELRECDDLLGRIYNPVSSDELLGNIFKKFCIGK